MEHNIILRKDIPRKNGSCPVCYQTFFSGKRVQIPLKVYCSPENWDPVNFKINYNRRELRKNIDNFNRVIDHARMRAIDIDTRYHLSLRTLTPENFKREMLQEELKDDFIQFMIRSIPEVSKLKENSTKKKYNETVTKLRSFRQSFTFAELDEKLVTDFELYMRKQGLAINTRHRYHKTIKVFINYALSQSIFIPNPYSRFKPVQVKGNRTFLLEPERDELIELFNTDKLTRGHKQVLRYFLFACFTGLRISDVQTITHDNIINGELIFVPFKTKNMAKICKVHLNAYAKSFIETTSGLLFHTVTPQYTNRALREIMTYTSIKKKVTFHVARHTFATIFLFKGGKVEVLKEFLAHTKIETTMVYVHLVDSERKRQIMLMDKQI